MKTKKDALQPIRARGDRLLMAAYRSRLVPIKKITEMYAIIQQAFEAGLTARDQKASPPRL